MHALNNLQKDAIYSATANYSNRTFMSSGKFTVKFGNHLCVHPKLVQ